MISVIIPVYNGEDFICEALESVYRQEVALEVIVVDDGSTDNTIAVVMARNFPGLICVTQSNSGPSKARNTGIRHAKGDYIAFLDADDIWPDKKLLIQTDFLKQHPEAGLVGGLIDYFYMPGSEHRREQLQIDSPIFNVQVGGIVARREVFDHVGFFDESLRYSEDQDWILRIRESNIQLHILDQVVLLYRIHPGNATRHKTLKDLGVLNALKLSLERRRKSGNSALGELNKK